jgi:hypothetical protein
MEEVAERKTASTRNITSTSQVSKAAVMEIMAFHKLELEKGRSVTYSTISTHLQSQVRYCPCINLDILPPVLIKPAVLQYAMSKLGLLGFGRVKRSGKKLVHDEEHREQRLWKIRVQLARLHRSRVREQAGEVVVVSRDESFCHRGFCNELSLLAYDNCREFMRDCQRAARDGERICMSVCICRWGVISGYKGEEDAGPDSMPGTEPYRDHCFRNAHGVDVERGGTYQELNNKQELRFPATEKVVEWHKGLKSAIILLANAEGIDLLEDLVSGQPRRVPKLKAALIAELTAIYAARGAAQPASDSEPVATAGEQGVTTSATPGDITAEIAGKNWPAVIDAARDQALTTLKFFLANNVNIYTDYHNNFTVEETVKIYMCLVLSWVAFCKHQQLLQNRDMLQFDDKLPWYNFDTGRAVRKLQVWDDNAPYNYGIQVSRIEMTGASNLVAISCVVFLVGDFE